MGRPLKTENIEIGSERFNQLHPKIQAKILNARKVAEERAQKSEDKDALSTWLRFETLRAIPIKDRTQDERNEFDRLRRAMGKLEEKRKGSVSQGMTREKFWETNLANVSVRQVNEWRARQETVLDTLAWMDRVENGTETVENCGSNFVDLEEGVEDLLRDVKDFGCARLGYQFADEDIPGDWFDGFFTGLAFYKTPEVYRALCAENEATKIYVSYGILTALPDWRVYEFLRGLSGSDTSTKLRPFYWSPRAAAEIVGKKFNQNTNRMVYA